MSETPGKYIVTPKQKYENSPMLLTGEFPQRGIEFTKFNP